MSNEFRPYTPVHTDPLADSILSQRGTDLELARTRGGEDAWAKALGNAVARAKEDCEFNRRDRISRAVLTVLNKEALRVFEDDGLFQRFMMGFAEGYTGKQPAIRAFRQWLNTY